MGGFSTATVAVLNDLSQSDKKIHQQAGAVLQLQCPDFLVPVREV
jgi:hypothetical protein